MSDKLVHEEKNKNQTQKKTSSKEKVSEENQEQNATVTLSPFTADKPAVWFALTEAQFSLANVTNDSVKYNHVLSQLDARHAAQIEDIITSPPEKNKYEHLKTELIKRMSAVSEQQIRQLLQNQKIGNQNPLQFLAHLRTLVPTSQVSEKILKAVWIQLLPNNVQNIIRVVPDLELDQSALLADKITDLILSMQKPTVSAPPQQNPPGFKALTKDIKKLTEKIQSLEVSVNEMNNDDDDSYDDNNPNILCWYHRKFKGNADRCVGHCNW